MWLEVLGFRIVLSDPSIRRTLEEYYVAKGVKVRTAEAAKEAEPKEYYYYCFVDESRSPRSMR